MKSTVRFMKNLWRGEGASAAKYALILAIVGAGIAAAIVLGGAFATDMNDASTCISTDGVTSCQPA